MHSHVVMRLVDMLHVGNVELPRVNLNDGWVAPQLCIFESTLD